jgi:hypothetical protein
VISYHPIVIRRVRVPEDKLEVSHTAFVLVKREGGGLPAHPGGGKRLLCKLWVTAAKGVSEEPQG